MNVANLQLEGLCLAIAAINHALVEKGILSQLEIDEALRKAEATARGDNRFIEDLKPSTGIDNHHPFVGVACRAASSMVSSLTTKGAGAASSI